MSIEIMKRPKWRRKMGTVIGVIFGIVFLTFLITGGWMMSRIKRGTVSDLTTRNRNGTRGTALVVYHPG